MLFIVTAVSEVYDINFALAGSHVEIRLRSVDAKCRLE